LPKDEQHKSERIAREAEGYYELQLFDDALERAERLLEFGHEVPFAETLRAECLRSLERYDEGAEAYELILKVDPASVAAWVGLGWCRKRSGRLDLAIECMQGLLEHRPNEGIGFYNLACYLSLNGEHDRALALLSKSISIDSGFRRLAPKEDDFAAIRSDPGFRRLVEESRE
jgi:tetratricopeptide (TPR) repeat protein